MSATGHQRRRRELEARRKAVEDIGRQTVEGNESRPQAEAQPQARTLNPAIEARVEMKLTIPGEDAPTPKRSGRGRARKAGG